MKKVMTCFVFLFILKPNGFSQQNNYLKGTVLDSLSDVNLIFPKLDPNYGKSIEVTLLECSCCICSETFLATPPVKLKLNSQPIELREVGELLPRDRK